MSYPWVNEEMAGCSSDSVLFVYSQTAKLKTLNSYAIPAVKKTKAVNHLLFAYSPPSPLLETRRILSSPATQINS